MLYDDVQPQRIDPSWWPFIRERARKFQMMRELEAQAQRFFERDVPEYGIDDRVAPAQNETDALAADHGDQLRRLLHEIRKRGEPARIRLRKRRSGSFYGFSSIQAGITEGGRQGVAWFSPDLADRTRSLHGIDLVLDEGVTLVADYAGAGGDVQDDTIFQLGHYYKHSDDRPKAIDAFLDSYTDPCTPYWGAADATAAAAVLGPYVYEIAGQRADMGVTVPAGSTSVALERTPPAGMVAGDRIALCWGQTLGGTRGAEQPWVHYATVLGVDGATVHFTPALWRTAEVLAFPAGHEWAAGGVNEVANPDHRFRPITLAWLEPQCIREWALRGEGAGATIVNRTRSALWGSGEALFGQYVTNLMVRMDNDCRGLARGNGVEDVLIRDVRASCRLRAGVTASYYQSFSGSDKAGHRTVVKNVRTIPGEPTEMWTRLHCHEGVRDYLVLDCHFEFDDTRQAVRDQWSGADGGNGGQGWDYIPNISCQAGDHDLWIEGVSLAFTTGTYVPNADPHAGIRIDDTATGFCVVGNVDFRGAHMIVENAAPADIGAARSAWWNVRGDGVSTASRVADGDLECGSAAVAAAQVELWSE